MTLDVFVQGPPPPPAVATDKVYTIAPVSVTVRAGRLTGVITDMRVLAQGEPRLTGTLSVTNALATHSVRLVEVKIQYLDDRWQPIQFESSRIEATFKFTAYGTDRLDPGQEAVQAVDVPCPTEALMAGRLKGLRLEIAYVTSPYREEVISFAVSIDHQHGEK